MNQTATVLFDGTCNLCDATVRFIIANDAAGRFRFAPLRSAAAARVLAPFATTSLRDSIIVVDAAGVHERSDAALRIARGLPAPWRWIAWLAVIPAGWRDRVYDTIARNRYRWFGQRTVCRLPRPSDTGRFLSDDVP